MYDALKNKNAKGMCKINIQYDYLILFQALIHFFVIFTDFVYYLKCAYCFQEKKDMVKREYQF